MMNLKSENEQASKPSKIVLVTGAAQRLGRAIALYMAEHGWDIVVHYGASQQAAMSLVQEIEKMGRRAMALQADLRNEAAVNNLIPQVLNAWGRLDCVVNNASMFEADTAHNFSQDLLDRHMHVNLTAPVLLAKALHQHKVASAAPDLGCVINLLDQKLFNLNPDYLSYTLSKAALQCATTTLAQALAPQVRVVGLAPGLSLPSGSQTQSQFEAAHQATPLKQSSTPDDIAQAVLYLAQARAITGTVLTVDGGQHLIPSQRDVMFLTTLATGTSTFNESN